MIKKILFIQIIFLILCSCSSFSLEEKPVSDEQKDASLRITEVMFIKNQIEDKREQLVGDLEGIKVKIQVELNVDGSVTRTQIKDIVCPPGKTELCQLVSENIERAVRKASPLKNLRPDRHDIWKKFDLDFYPGSYKS